MSLHDGIEDEQHYHVLIPCDNAQLRVETALGSLAASETLAAPRPSSGRRGRHPARLQTQLDAEAQTAVTVSVAAIQALGHQAVGEFSSDDPIESLDEVGAADESAAR